MKAADMSGAAEIERAFEDLARETNVGILILPSPAAETHRDLIIALAARHRFPAVYSDRSFVTSGGLMSYGLDARDLFRRAAFYVDRILRGERPGELPVQQPTKFDLAVNLKAAKAIGLEIPPLLLARADEVIE